MLLAVLQRTLGVVDDSLGRNLKSALAKLTIDSRLPEPLRATMGEQHLLTMGRPERDPGRAHLAVLGEALGRRRRVEFRYHTVDANRTERRRVRPYGLGLADGNWHLVGHDEGREDLRNFRLDRIRGKVAMADKKDGAYEVPEDFDVARFVDRPEFEIEQGPEVEVVIELDPVATWLMARRRQGVGALEVLEDGRGRYRATVRSEGGLFRWLAEFGQRARIVEPERLAKAYEGHLRDARARYA
jgi:predicted DNA-binding transcriptional regulator YafY